MILEGPTVRWNAKHLPSSFTMFEALCDKFLDNFMRYIRNPTRQSHNSSFEPRNCKVSLQGNFRRMNQNHSLDPFDASDTPLPWQLQTRHGQSSSLRLTRIFHRSRCCVDAHSLLSLTSLLPIDRAVGVVVDLVLPPASD